MSYEMIDRYLYAIDEEYDYLSKNKTKMLLLEGKELYPEEDGFVYSFKTIKEIGIPDSTPVVVYNNGKSYLGEVLYTESDEIVLYVKGKLSLREKIEFSSAVQELLKALANKIRNIDYDDYLIQLLLKGKDYLASSALIAKGQDNAIINSTTQPITIIWGPPGTGKTFTLAEIAMKMYKNGKSVLILSQSNIAVDNAMLEIKKRTTLFDEGKIFRAGYSKVKEIVSRSNENDIYINVKQYVEKTHPEVIEKLNYLLKEKEVEAQKALPNQQSLRFLTEQIKNTRKLIRSFEDSIIRNAKIIGTTISKATIDSKISERKFDVVLFDESSMAYVPQILYACSLAKEHFICVGDFRQLPPIVQCNEQNILNYDIFNYLGIYNGSSFNNHKWLVMLNEQRRMHPSISNFVKKRIYNNELIDHPTVSDKHRDIIRKEPFSNCSIGYFDIDAISSNALAKEVGKTHSHFNIVSAVISVLIGIRALNDGQKNISIITPYKNQVTLIKAILNDNNIPQDSNGITCSTIHQFQGREGDVIIFDTVDGAPMKHLGKMLTSGDESLRLINVAITRARGKFILVGSKSKAPFSSMIHHLWNYVSQYKEVSIESLMDLVYTKRIRILDQFDKLNIEDNASLITFISSTVSRDILCIYNNKVIDDGLIVFDKNYNANELKISLGKIDELVKKRLVYQSIRCIDDIIIQNKNTFLPIYKKNNKKVWIIALQGVRIQNALFDLEVDDIKKDIEHIAPLNPVGRIGSKLVICPKCELNYIYEGQGCCSVCLGMIGGGKKPFKEENAVDRWEIYQLWCDLIGKTYPFEWNEIKAVLLKNKKIQHKNTLYDKLDVFNEFFLVDKTVGRIIKELNINSYEELNRKKDLVYEKFLQEQGIEPKIVKIVNNNTTVTLKEIPNGNEWVIDVNTHKDKSHTVLLGKKLNELVNFNGKAYMVWKVESK